MAMHKKRQRLYIFITIAIVVIATVTLTVTALASGADTDQTALPISTDISVSDQPTSTPPPPDSGAPTEPVPTPGYYGTDKMIELQQKVMQATTDEERAAAYEELTEERIKAGEIIPVTYAGPTTRGSAIQIAGKKVQLPDDAELGGISVCSYGAPSLSGQKGVDYGARWVIIRGKSQISIGINSGIVMSGYIAPGEGGAFDFLKEYFPDQTDAIDSIPVSPKQTILPVDWGFDIPEAEE